MLPNVITRSVMTTLRAVTDQISYNSDLGRAREEERTMEIASMGRVTTEATIENLSDLVLADRGLLPRDQVRRIQVSDALVDMGATLLAMPARMIQQLGLDKRS